MNDQALDGAIAVVGVASIASLFLPSIEEMWDAPPHDGEQRKRLRTGETVYFLILGTAGLLQSLRSRSIFPLVFVIALGAVVTLTFERALTAKGSPDEAAS